MIDKTTSQSIVLCKGILLIGVIIIHCNPLSIVGHTSGISHLIDFITPNITRICVPSFFILSGFLFYSNIRGWEPSIFINKIKKRVFSLLIPYIIWCTIYAVVQILKAKYLGYNGLGIIVNNHFELSGFLKSFWETPNGYPIGFALWFIRNLICFSLLSPILYFIVRSPIITVSFITISYICNISLYGMEYFIVGGMLGMNGILTRTHFHRYLIVASVLFLIMALYFTFQDNLDHIFYFLYNLIGFYVIYNLSYKIQILYPNFNTRISAFLSSSFFLYVMHGMYATLIIKFYIGLIGSSQSLSVFLVFIMSTITDISLSYIIYLLLKRISPKLLGVLQGFRPSNTNSYT